MGKTSRKSKEVVCPCCQSTLLIDLSMGVVLHHELPPKPAAVTDLKEAVEALKGETAQRDARFKERMQAEKDKGKILDRKFQELLKKAKDTEPTPPPPRDIDLD